MKQVVAVVLVVLLAAPPALAGEKPPKAIDWRQLKPGTTVVLTLAGAEPVTERVLFVNQSVLVTRKAAPPKLPGRVEKALRDAGSWWPDIFEHGATGRSGSIGISTDGVFDGDRKLADLAAVVRHTPRENVLALSEPSHSHAGYWILIGAVAFLVIIGVLSPKT